MNSLIALPITAAMPVDAPALVPSTEAKQLADPIFAAIDVHRQLEAACSAVPRGLDIPDELGDRRSDAFHAVMRTRPTTPGGLAALTTWAREEADALRKSGSMLYADDLYALVATIDDAARGMTGLRPWSPADAPAEADSELVELGERFASLIEKYDEAVLAERPRNEELERAFSLLQSVHAPNRVPKDIRDALIRSCNEKFPLPSPSVDDLDELIIPLGEKINEMQAHTLEGFKAKALLVHHWPHVDLSKTDDKWWPEKVLRDLLIDLIGYEKAPSAQA